MNNGEIKIRPSYPRVLPAIRSISAHFQNKYNLQHKQNAEKITTFHPRAVTHNEFKRSENLHGPEELIRPLPWDLKQSSTISTVPVIEEIGRSLTEVYKTVDSNTSNQSSQTQIKMSEQKFTTPYRRSTPSPPPPYVNQIHPAEAGGPLNSNTNSDSKSGRKKSMYPPNDKQPKLFHNSLKAKHSWKSVKKTSKRVLPLVRRTSSGCCATYVSAVISMKNNKSLMLVWHISLFFILAVYLVVGAYILTKVSSSITKLKLQI